MLIWPQNYGYYFFVKESYTRITLNYYLLKACKKTFYPGIDNCPCSCCIEQQLQPVLQLSNKLVVDKLSLPSSCWCTQGDDFLKREIFYQSDTDYNAGCDKTLEGNSAQQTLPHLNVRRVCAYLQLSLLHSSCLTCFYPSRIWVRRPRLLRAFLQV